LTAAFCTGGRDVATAVVAGVPVFVTDVLATDAGDRKSVV